MTTATLREQKTELSPAQRAAISASTELNKFRLLAGLSPDQLRQLEAVSTSFRELLIALKGEKCGDKN